MSCTYPVLSDMILSKRFGDELQAQLTQENESPEMFQGLVLSLTLQW